ncbi:MAG TPA: Nramp family divalent metal transporter [Thermoanaerobaculia bacterium]|nr:Nramp family divalent metal transporter [Thermoanaerobaculia bacterium]
MAGRPGGGRAVAPRPRSRLLALVGPGLLVAATGVGAGDLATAAFTGDALGAAVLWAVVAGAGIKYVLNEGLARWQLATGETLLEGALTRWRGRLAGPLRVAFLAYFLAWSFLVAAALMSACGAVAHAVWPLTGSADGDKLLYGLAHSAAGVVLVRLGGFRLFERVMGAAIGLMFVTVVATAVRVAPDWGAVAAGLLVPRIPDLPGATGWTVALMGGVGGTLTVLCYGYWIREEGRESPADLGLCRLDLGVGYAMTALFGVAMVVVGSTVEVAGSGAGLVVALADRLEATLGPAGRWTFLAGAWAAVATSLLGVWQSVPYLFADQWRLLRGGAIGQDGRAEAAGAAPAEPAAITEGAPYRRFLYALATVPAIGLVWSFSLTQRLYAITGALFMPMLALALLALAGSARHIGATHRNRPLTNAALVAILAFFTVLLGQALR